MSAATRPRLSPAQSRALLAGSGQRWLGRRESGTAGDTMAALERRGLAEVRTARKPYRRCVYRLTPAGVEARDALRPPKPIAEFTEDELIAAYIAGDLGLEDYAAERDRRTVVDEHPGESQCVECGEWKADPDEFWSGLVCIACAEVDG